MKEKTKKVKYQQIRYWFSVLRFAFSHWNIFFTLF